MVSAVGSMHLEQILRQVEPDRDIFRHDRVPLWTIADAPWHIDAVGGRSHRQCQLHQKPKVGTKVGSFYVKYNL